MNRTAPSRARPPDRSFLGAALSAVLFLPFANCGDRQAGPDQTVRAKAIEDAQDEEDTPSRVRVRGDTQVLAPNPSGIGRTVTPTGFIDTNNLFFQSVGINGRACVSCHVASQGWTITPAGVRDRFEETDGLDPIFRTNDGSNSPLADVSTVEARRSAYSIAADSQSRPSPPTSSRRSSR